MIYFSDSLVWPYLIFNIVFVNIWIEQAGLGPLAIIILFMIVYQEHHVEINNLYT